MSLVKMSNLLFSGGGIDASIGLRGGQISHKLTGQYESLILNNQNVHSKDKIVIIVKFLWDDIKLLQHLKSNGNKLIFDMVDLTDKEIYNSDKNNNIPNFLPDIHTEYFDGYILNNTKMKDWWVKNIDTDESKPIFIIPHHWDMRFAWFPKGYYDEQPYFYFLGTDASEGNREQNCLHLNKLLEENLIQDWREGGPAGVCRVFLDRPVNGCQLSIRKKNSWEYCMKPATKLVTSAAMDSVIITTNDWSIQDILPSEYPYLLESSGYDDVVDMIRKVEDTFGGDEWILAKKILKQVKSENSLDVLIEKYKEIDNFFNTEN